MRELTTEELESVSGGAGLGGEEHINPFVLSNGRESFGGGEHIINPFVLS